MADNVTIPATGSGTATPVVATDDVGGVHFQKIKINVGGNGVDTDLSATNPLPVSVGATLVTPFELSLTVTRPNDTTTYASGDSIADSTSAPTAFTISGFGRVNGGGGVIQHVILTDSLAPALKAQLELWIFRSSYTNNNDNAAIAFSDADNDKVIAVIPLGGSPSVGGANCMYEAEVFKPYVTGGASTSLWFALVVRNAYIPAALETFKVVFQGYQTN